MAKVKKAKKKTLLDVKNERIHELEGLVKEHSKESAANHRQVMKLEAEQEMLAVLLGVDGKNESRLSYAVMDSGKQYTLFERSMRAIMKLQSDFAREDEGSAIEAEKSDQLMEVIGIILDDPTRKMQEHRRLVIAKGVAEGKIDPRYLDERMNVQRRDGEFGPSF